MILILRSVGRPDLGYRAISWEIEMLPGRASRASSPGVRGTFFGFRVGHRDTAVNESKLRGGGYLPALGQPPFHAFLHLHTCEFSLIPSACFSSGKLLRRCDGEKGKRGAESDRDTQNPQYPQPTAVYWLLFWPLYAPQ